MAYYIDHTLYRTPTVGSKILETGTIPRTLFAFGINHKTASVEVREKLYLNDEEIKAFLHRVQNTLQECLVVSTCNRTEIYGVSASTEIDLKYLKDVLIDIKDAGGYLRDEHFFSLISCTACQQLFSVATSIDSKVVGDSQILKQLREAYATARAYGSTGKILNQLLQRAFKLGKTTYTETSIHEGAISVSLAAVELALRTFGSLRRRTALVIGAGETARLTAEALVNKRIGTLLVTNRTRQHADELLSSLDQNLVFEKGILDFGTFKERLPRVDVVISSTGSKEPILHKQDLADQARTTLVIDIAVPRDIDTSVSELRNVILKNIDDLNTIIGENQERRHADLPKVKALIAAEMVDFLTWYYLLSILPNYEKTGLPPSAEQRHEILLIKDLLNRHLPEIHELARQAGANFQQDLESHHSLIRKLRAVKAQTFGAQPV
ncbi:MAG: glutamyl-tRNA reductase [Pyrinomonadaceae bacterium]